MAVKKTKTRAAAPAAAVAGAPGTFDLHGQTFTDKNGQWLRSNGKAVGAKGVGILNAAAAPEQVNGVGVTHRDAQWLAGDQDYGSQTANLVDQLGSYQADRLNQRQNYAQDEVDALTKLGFKGAIYRPGVATLDDPAPVPTINTANAGWDQHDESGAFGRDMVANADAFAARGAANSGAFLKSIGNLGQQYADQGSAIVKAATRQQGDYTDDLTNYAKQNMQAQNQALYDSLARRAATYTRL